MKKLALIFLALPLAACATPQQTASGGNCDSASVFYELCVAFQSAGTKHNTIARDFPNHPFAGVPAYAPFQPYMPH